MRLHDVKKNLLHLIQNDQWQIPVLQLGPPGIGKTSIFSEIAAETDLPLKIVRVQYHDIVDFSGLPMPTEDNYVRFMRSMLIPGPQDGPKGIFVLDDLGNAPPAVQNVCYQIMTEWGVGEHKFEGWYIFSTSNRVTDRGNVYPIPAPLANRTLILDVNPSPKEIVEDFTAWGIRRGGIVPEITGFLNFRPDLALQFKPELHQSGKYPFPTPRSWEKVSRLLKIGLDSHEVIAGAVGEGASIEFSGFLKVFRELPDREKIYSEPMKVKVPSEPAALYAVCGAMIHDMLSKNFPDKKVEGAFEFLSRLPKEFQVMVAYQASNPREQKSRILSLPCVMKWMTNNYALLT